MTEFYKLVVGILKQNGYTLYRQGKGSHEF
jgi:predicted RNA binding protein YcfA (HicA-like mRNA interferase family)